MKFLILSILSTIYRMLLITAIVVSESDTVELEDGQLSIVIDPEFPKI